MLERVFAFKVFPAGIEPASVIVSDRSTYELRTGSYFDVRAPAASFPFGNEIPHAVCLSPAGY